MSFASYGDLASSFHARSLSARMKQDMAQLGVELTTGQKVDLSAAVSGDFGPIAGIEHSLKLLDAHKQSTDQAELLFGATQIALGNIQDQVQDLSNGLISAVSTQNTVMINSTAIDAREKFASIVSNLNTGVAGQSLFAGAASDGAALADSDVIISDLMAAISSETTASGVATQIDAWFNDVGGGFELGGYMGASEDMGPIRLGNGEAVTPPIKASDTEIRDLLSALAKTVVIAEGALSGDVIAQKELVGRSSSELFSAMDQLTMSRARVGAIEARVENASVQNTAEKSALELSRNNLTAADPYDTATALQALYGQMESLYTVTARLSKLNFTEFMR